MTENETKLPEEDHTPPPADPSQVLSPRRRSALVTYLAVLFAVAFLLVAVMMVFETRRLKGVNEEIKESSQKTSASLTGKIDALQEENRELAQTNQELNARVSELEEEARTAAAAATELEQALNNANTENQALTSEKQGLEKTVEALTKQAEDAVNVSELLHRALAADEEGDLDALQALLDQIEPMKDLLSPTEREIYEELAIA